MLSVPPDAVLDPDAEAVDVVEEAVPPQAVSMVVTMAAESNKDKNFFIIPSLKNNFPSNIERT